MQVKNNFQYTFYQKKQSCLQLWGRQFG